MISEVPPNPNHSVIPFPFLMTHIYCVLERQQQVLYATCQDQTAVLQLQGLCQSHTLRAAALDTAAKGPLLKASAQVHFPCCTFKALL